MNKEIEFLSIEEARLLYVDLTGCSAPRNLSLKLLRKSIHWHIQCARFNIPERQANIHISSASIRIKSIVGGPQIGSLLLKEWRGTVHEVRRTTENQYTYGGKTFSSLSAVASFITGCKRSGPRFFGLAELTGQVR